MGRVAALTSYNLKRLSQDAQQVEAALRMVGQVVWPHWRTYNIKHMSQDAQQVGAGFNPAAASGTGTAGQALTEVPSGRRASSQWG